MRTLRNIIAGIIGIATLVIAANFFMQSNWIALVGVVLVGLILIGVVSPDDEKKVPASSSSSYSGHSSSMSVEQAKNIIRSYKPKEEYENLREWGYDLDRRIEAKRVLKEAGEGEWLHEMGHGY